MTDLPCFDKIYTNSGLNLVNDLLDDNLIFICEFLNMKDAVQLLQLFIKVPPIPVPATSQFVQKSTKFSTTNSLSKETG